MRISLISSLGVLILLRYGQFFCENVDFLCMFIDARILFIGRAIFADEVFVVG